VQAIFKRIFNPEPGFATDGGQFDHLFADGEAFPIGKLAAAYPAPYPRRPNLSRRRRRFRRGHAVYARLRHGARRFSRRRRWSALSLHSPHSRTSRGYAPIHLPRLQARRARSHAALGCPQQILLPASAGECGEDAGGDGGAFGGEDPAEPPNTGTYTADGDRAVQRLSGSGANFSLPARNAPMDPVKESAHKEQSPARPRARSTT
jgi:hypothetical protein